MCLNSRPTERAFKENLIQRAPLEIRSRIFFSNVVAKEEYLRRMALVHLTLDTWMCCGHTTSLDCIWAGTPIVTLRGSTFHSRVTSSIYNVFQLSTLVTYSPQDFINRAIWFGNNPNS